MASGEPELGDLLDRPLSAALGKYQLVGTLGRGGMADVYLAVLRGPLGFNKLAVVKRLRTSGIEAHEEPAYVSMFLDEARLAARLNHANVVHTYEVGESDGAYFIAMEYLEGQALQRVLALRTRKKLPFPPRLAVRIVCDALAGLHHAHELTDYDGTPLGIIHRDVSPHNVFVTYDGQVKLVDFGIAKAALSSTQTDVGVVKGKTAYMAPEQALGLPLDRRADLFAMGIVLWELLTLRRLMAGESSAGSLHKLLNVPIPRVREIVPGIDPDLDELVARALERDVGRRWATARELRAALEEWLGRAGRVSQEEVGEAIAGMFGDVREEVRRRVQAVMASASPEMTTDDLARINLEVDPSDPPAASGAVAIAGAPERVPASAPPPSWRTAPGSPQAIRRESAGGLLAATSGGVDVATPAGPLTPAGSWRTSAPLLAPPPSDLFASLGVEMETGEPRGRRRNAAVALGVLACLSFVFIALWLGVLREQRAAPTSPAASAASTPATPPGTSAAPAPRATAIASSATAIAHGATAIASSVTATPESRGAATAAATPNAGGSARRRATAAPTAPATHASAAVEEAPGFLTLDTFPWTRVSENGRALGTTPLARVALGAGPHTLTLENPDQGLRQTLTVTIKPNETLIKRVPLK